MEEVVQRCKKFTLAGWAALKYFTIEPRVVIRTGDSNHRHPPATITIGAVATLVEEEVRAVADGGINRRLNLKLRLLNNNTLTPPNDALNMMRVCCC